MAKYVNLRKQNGDFEPNQKVEVVPRLEPGAYSLGYNETTKEVFFRQESMNYDALIDLPSEEYDMVMKEMDIFLKPETKEIFDQFGYLYKRSILLHGVPGTGKTCIVNRVAEKVQKSGGIVLFNPHPDLLKMAFKVLDDVQKDTNLMIILEEFDELIEVHGERKYLHILDGEIQKNNVIYLATTNYIKKINPRIYRPGRFASVIQVGFPSQEAREFYLSMKLGTEENVKKWAKKTDGLSIDELKETVLATKCLGQSLDDVVDKIKQLKQNVNNIAEEKTRRRREKTSFLVKSNDDNGDWF